MTETANIHASEDRLLDLVEGLLSPPERAATLRHLKTCVTCEERFRTVGREAEILRMHTAPGVARDALQGPGAPANAIPGATLGPGSESPGASTLGATVATSGGSRMIWAAGVIAAAVALIALVASWPLLRPSTSERDDRRALGADPDLDYWLPGEGEELMLRSEPEGEDSEVRLGAVEAYRRHDTARVVELLEGRQFSRYDPLPMLLASALVWQGRNAEARDLLLRLDVDQIPPPYRDRGRWILYASRKRLGEDAAASAIARQLASRPGEFQERAARALARDHP